MAPRLPWTSVLPHEKLESPPVSVHQRSEWCRFMRFLLIVMRYHPVQVSLDAAPPTDTIAVIWTWLHMRSMQSYMTRSNYSSPSFHQPESVIQPNVTLLLLFVFHPYMQSCWYNYLSFSLVFSFCLFIYLLLLTSSFFPFSYVFFCLTLSHFYLILLKWISIITMNCKKYANREITKMAIH